MKKKSQATDRLDREYMREVSEPNQQQQQDVNKSKQTDLARALMKKYKLDAAIVMKLAGDIAKRGLKGLQKIKENVFYVFFNDGGRAYIDGARYSTSKVDYKRMIIQRASKK